MSLKLSLVLLAHTSSLTPLTVLAYSQNEVREKGTASLNRKSPEVTLTLGSKLQSEVQGLNLPFNVIFSSNCHWMVVILNGAAILEFSFLQLSFKEELRCRPVPLTITPTAKAAAAAAAALRGQLQPLPLDIDDGRCRWTGSAAVTKAACHQR